VKPGDLVRLYEPNNSNIDFSIGNLDRGLGGWSVPPGTIAIVTEIIPDHGDGTTYHVLVDGKMGWVYEEDCEMIE